MRALDGKAILFCLYALYNDQQGLCIAEFTSHASPLPCKSDWVYLLFASTLISTEHTVNICIEAVLSHGHLRLARSIVEELRQVRPAPQETRLGSYNNYANLEEDTAQGLQRLHSMFAVCGEPPRVRSACCRSLLSESCPHLTRHPAEVLMKLALAPKQSECFPDGHPIASGSD